MEAADNLGMAAGHHHIEAKLEGSYGHGEDTTKYLDPPARTAGHNVADRESERIAKDT